MLDWKEERNKMMKLDFFQQIFLESNIPQGIYICGHFCKLVGSIISASLDISFVATLAIILLIQLYSKFKNSLPIPTYIENATPFSDMQWYSYIS